MARQKVRLADNIARVVFIETNATEGATLGTNLYLPNGVAATPASLAAWLGGATFTGQATQQAHQLLSGLTSGNDHPQYLLRATLTTDGDLLTRESGSVTRLPIGTEGDVLTVSGGLPAWVAAVVASGVELSEGPEPPPYPEVGQFWWDTYYEALYIYTSLGWYDVSTGTPGAPGVPGDTGTAYNPATEFVAEDDFCTRPGAGSSPNPWYAIATGSGAAVDNVQRAEIGHPGVVSLATGTTSSGRVVLAYGTSSVNPWGIVVPGGGAIQFDALVKVPVAPNGSESFEIQVGLGDAAFVSLPPDEAGIYFRTVAGSGIWKYVTRSFPDTTEEVEASLAIADDTWTHLRIVINAAGTEAAFYVDGDLRHTATADFPTVGMTMFATIIKTFGSTERKLYLDYMGVRQTFSAARW